MSALKNQLLYYSFGYMASILLSGITENTLHYNINKIMLTDHFESIQTV